MDCGELILARSFTARNLRKTNLQRLILRHCSSRKYLPLNNSSRPSTPSHFPPRIASERPSPSSTYQPSKSLASCKRKRISGKRKGGGWTLLLLLLNLQRVEERESTNIPLVRCGNRRRFETPSLLPLRLLLRTRPRELQQVGKA